MISSSSKDFLDKYQKDLFGKYVNYTAIDGVNNSKVPNFIAHGLNDEVINFELQSLISHRNEITNKNVEYYFGQGSQAKHTSILFSDNANEMQMRIEKEFKDIDKKYKKDEERAYQEKAKICSEINHYLYSEINYVLFDKIIEFFNKF